MNGGALIRDHLVVMGTGLYELCGERVWVKSAPKGWTNTAAGMRLQALAGSSRTLRGGLSRIRLMVLCYGGKGSEPTWSYARSVWEALSDRLHGAKSVSYPRGTILSAWNEDAGEEHMDAETGWAAVMTYYAALVKE